MNFESNQVKNITSSAYSQPFVLENNSSDDNQLNTLYTETKRFNQETTSKVNQLVEENLKLNSLLLDANKKNQEFENKLLDKDILIAEKEKEIDYLNNKINFMEKELMTKLVENDNNKFIDVNENFGYLGDMEVTINMLNEKIVEMTQDSQNSYNIIVRKTDENNILHEMVSKLTMRGNDLNEMINELKNDLNEKEVSILYQGANIEKLKKEIEILERNKDNYEYNIVRLLNENAKLQKNFQDLMQKYEHTIGHLNEALFQKTSTVAEFEEELKKFQEKVAELESEKGNLTIGFALENLKFEEKIKKKSKNLEEISSSAEVIENLNKIIIEKIEENKIIQNEKAELLRIISEKTEENQFLYKENEEFKNQIRKKEAEKEQKNSAIAKQQMNLEKLLNYIDSLNQLIYNQKIKISSLNDSNKLNSELFEEFKHFWNFLFQDSPKEFEFSSEYYQEFFHDLKGIIIDLRQEIREFKEKILSLVMINENFIRIIENNSSSPDEIQRMLANQKKNYEEIIENFKKKIYLILDENRKLNIAFEKIEKSNKIFKSWSEPKSFENMSLQNELNTAKKNILLLLKNNKELIEKYKTKNENITVFEQFKKTQFTENNEKYLFQISSLKKQMDILKEMNKNRGMVIENLLKKLKNQRIN